MKKLYRRIQPCHSRRDVDPDADLYFCAHPKVSSRANLVSSGVCKHCKLHAEPPPEQFLPFRLPPAHLYDGPCGHLGEQIDLRECKSCRGSVKVKVFACHHPSHKETTIRDCRLCEDYQPQETVASQIEK